MKNDSSGSFDMRSSRGQSLHLGATAQRIRADMRYSWRSLRSDRGYSISAVASLAIGIGGAALTFGILLTLLFPTLPYRDQDRLGVVQPAPSWDVVERLKRVHAFDAVAVYNEQAANLVGGTEPQRILVGRVTADFIRVADVRVVAGRSFNEGDFSSGHEDVALLTSGIWRRNYGAAPDVIGRAISLDDRPYVVAGIIDDSFQAPTQIVGGRGLSLEVGAAVLIPLISNPVLSSSNATDRMWRGLNVILHLRPDATFAQADTEVQSVAQSLPRHANVVHRVVPFARAVRGDLPRELPVVGLAALLLLTVACANAASLALGFWNGRQIEQGARLAFGATHAQLVRLPLFQAAQIAWLGGVCALATALIGVLITRAVAAEGLSGLNQLRMDMRLVAAGFGIAAVAAAAAAVIPVNKSASMNPYDVLRGGQAASWRPRRLSIPSVLVAAEIAMCCAALVCAGVIGETLINQSRADLGFQTAHILTADVSLSRVRYPSIANTRAFFRALLEQASTMSGVESVALGTTAPGGPATTIANITVAHASESLSAASSADDAFVGYDMVTPNYFHTLSIPVLAGRPFDDKDSSSAVSVAVINAAFARRHWIVPSAALGDRIAFGRREYLIVGVIGDIRGVRSQAEPTAYFLYDQFPQSAMQMTLLIRSNADAASHAQPLRQVMQRLDPNQPLYNVLTLDRIVFAPLARLRLIGAMTVVFALLSVLLSTLGVYAAMSRVVIERQRELAVRMAVGGSPQRMFRHVMVRTSLLLVAGVIVGTPLAYVVVSVLRSRIAGIGSPDPALIVSALLIVCVAAVAGAVLPAARAARSEPALLLRCY